MVKGGKRHSSLNNDGKWFAHPVFPENETSREACTSTGIMLSQVKSSSPQALYLQRYPKWKTQQESRDYPFSGHDNKHALEEISVLTTGVGRRKYLGDQNQHKSNICLYHDGASSSPEQTGGNITVHQTDITGKPAVNVPTSTRRFTRNHQQKSAEAAVAQAGETFMWFGRHDSHFSHSMEMLAATNCSAPSKDRMVLFKPLWHH